MVDGVGKLAKDMSVKVLRQELIANNLANVNTPGFKTQRGFSTLLRKSMKGAEAGLLATYGGNLVMGVGGPIAVQGEEVEITPDGSVVVDGEEVDTLMVVAFSDPENLDRQGNIFASNNARYEDVDFSRTKIVQGALERSNVNPIDEMVEMIALHRGFEADQRSVTLQIEASKKLLERVGDLG
ncbi:unnamed protein product [marine sediment metagenome]|uniref:Flagellar basal body rod protein N-terminal domain-containing protein n=1 Tax=marine sediment metagenome TaxID=412755 RepID=X0TCP6_9ZZZZ